MRHIGIDLSITNKESILKDKAAKRNFEPQPLNKVGDYCKGKDNNTMIRVETQEQHTLAILDRGARAAITTKTTMRKPPMRNTNMKL